MNTTASQTRPSRLPHHASLAGQATSRRELAREAEKRLRRYVLLGLAFVLFLDAVVCCVLSLLDGAVDPNLAMAFAPDLVVAGATWWLTERRRAMGAATTLMAVYLAANFTFIFLHVDSWRILGTGWPLLPPLLGLYLGGRRLGLWMGVATGAGIAVSLLVRQTGVGLTTIAFPSLDEPSGTALAAAGGAVVFVLIQIYERSRWRTRVELDEALAELDDKDRTLAALIDTTSDAIMLLDAEHRVLVTNSRARALVHGVTERDGEIVGEPLLSVVAPERRAMWRERLGECEQVGQLRVEDVIPMRSEVMHLETSLQCVGGEDGVVGFTLIARDITERRRAEEAMRALRRQLLDASRRAGRAEVASSVLHDVGNLLNSVAISVHQLGALAGGLRVESFRKTAELLTEYLVGEPGPAAAPDKALRLLEALVTGLEGDREALRAETRELVRFLAEVAAIVQAQERHAHADNVYEELDLEELLGAAIAASDDRGAATEVALSVADDARCIVSDRHKVIQILGDLLRAALDPRPASAPMQERIDASVRRSGDGVTVCVRGEGRLTEAEIVGIFRQGWGSEPARSVSLHTSSLLASQLGGRVGVESTARGATFSVELPFQPKELAA